MNCASSFSSCSSPLLQSFGEGKGAINCRGELAKRLVETEV